MASRRKPLEASTRSYECSCGFTTDFSASYQTHVQRCQGAKATQQAAFCCQLCGVEAPNRKSFAAHLEGRSHIKRERAQACLDNVQVVHTQQAAQMDSNERESTRQVRGADKDKVSSSSPEHRAAASSSAQPEGCKQPLAACEPNRVAPTRKAPRRGTVPDDLDFSFPLAATAWQQTAASRPRPRPQQIGNSAAGITGARAADDGLIPSCGPSSMQQTDSGERLQIMRKATTHDTLCAATSSLSLSAGQPMVESHACKDEPVPLEPLECPITLETIRDPVILVDDGHVYERDAIQEWLLRGNGTSPMTGLPISSGRIVPHAMRRETGQRFKISN